MSDVRDDIGYRPAPETARELLSQHRQAVDPVEPSPYTATTTCTACRATVGVSRWGVIAVHARMAGGRSALCPGSGDAVGRAA